MTSWTPMPMSRRGFLYSAGASALAFTVLPSFPALARGSRPAGPPLRRRRGKRVLVPIFLRGGADGLNMVVPYGDAHYRELRGPLAIPRPGAADRAAIDLDGFFALHPSLEPLQGFFKEGRLAVVQALGHARATRSHFAEQDTWETATAEGRVEAEGWLNRFLAEHTGDGPIRAVSFGTLLPRILRGEIPVQAVTRLEELRLLTGPDRRNTTLQALAGAYNDQGLVPETGQETLDAIDVLGDLDAAAYTPDHGATYPGSMLGRQMRQAAQLIKADVGFEVVELELGGWDTHQNQGGVAGQHANLMRDLATCIDAFLTDLGSHADEVLVFTLTEFGRTARVNGTGGTDHGHANCMFLLGSNLAGGRVHGAWPGLGPDDLNEQRDLAHTADFRDVFAEILAQHAGCRDPRQVLPGWEGRTAGLFVI